MSDAATLERASFATAQSKDASDKFRDDLHKLAKADARETVASAFDDPYSHVTMAGIAVHELQDLALKKDSDRITVTDAVGKNKDTTVGERRQELLTVVAKEFTTGIAAADRIDQKKIEEKLWQCRANEKTAANNPLETEKLHLLEATLERQKHAPSALRLGYAMFLADRQDLTKAKQYLDEAKRIDPEAGKDSVFKQFDQSVERSLRNHQKRIVGAEDFAPLELLNKAQEARKTNKNAAEENYKAAIGMADQSDKKLLASELTAIDVDRQANKDNPQALQQLDQRYQAFATLVHAPGITRLKYADFLMENQRFKEAKETLLEVTRVDPALVKDSNEFKEMLELARNNGRKPEPFDNPYQHMMEFQHFLKKGDINSARSALQSAVAAADKVDRSIVQNNRHEIEEQLKVEKDPEQRKALATSRDVCDALDHAAAFTRITLARFEIAAKNYNVAHDVLEQAKNLDGDLTSRPEVEYNKLLGEAQKPSIWRRAWDFTKKMFKELICDAAAVGAGAGTVALTGWTGFGALAAGGAAGGLVYTAMKKLLGEDIHWYTPIWGVVDGVSGAASVLARNLLARQAGRLVTKEMAELTVAKTGGDAAALSGLEGMQMAQTAQKLAGEGLKSMGKDLGFLTRLSSSIPFISAGNAEYRTALGAYRTLAYTNLATRAFVDFGTAATMSSIYRAGKDGQKYANGEYKSIGDFAKNYGLNVLQDSATGMTMGAFQSGLGNGFKVSATTRLVSEALSGRYDGPLSFGSGWIGGVMSDAAFGNAGWLLGAGAEKVTRWVPSQIGTQLPGAVEKIWVPTSPSLMDAYQQWKYMHEVVEPTLKDLQKPADPEDIPFDYSDLPGTETFPLKRR